MPLYPKSGLDMMIDLINADNPTLPVPVTKETIRIGAPTSISVTPGTIQDTSARLTCPASSPFIGSLLVNYRRPNIQNVFRSVPIVIYKYSSAGEIVTPFKMSDLLNDINNKYGLNLQASDIVDVSFPYGNTNANPTIGLPAGTRNSSATLKIAATSPNWQGSITVYWVQAPQDIGNMIAQPVLDTARTYPSGDTVTNTPYVVDLDTFGYDWTDTLNAIAADPTVGQPLTLVVNALTVGGPWGSLSTGYIYNSQRLMTAAIAQLTGQPYNLTSPASTPFSLYGAQGVQVNLPDGTNKLPEGNSRYFNRAFYVDLPSANSWGVGRMIFHYNV